MKSVKGTALTRREFLAAGGTIVGGATAAAAADRKDSSRPRSAPHPVSSPAPMKVQRLSWAGLKVECGTTTVLIDPTENKSAVPASDWVAIEATTPRRHVLLTHLHGDHYDPATVRSHLSEFGFVLCHRSVAATIAGAGFRARALELHEPALLRELCATAVEAVDGIGESEVSWIVSGGGRRIVHGGDTLWHGHWWKFAAQYGQFDAAFLPINAAIQSEPSPPSGLPISLNPEQAVAAARILGAEVLVPIHYGGSSPPEYVEFSDAVGETQRLGRARGVEVRIVKPGEWVDFPGGGAA